VHLALLGLFSVFFGYLLCTSYFLCATKYTIHTQFTADIWD